MVLASERPSQAPVSTPRVLHFGGNGHAAMRLERVQAALACRPDPAVLVDVPYPGFEGRPRAPSRDAFLDVLAEFCRAEQGSASPPVATVATGIGALVVLSLRARGELGHPLIFQGPVLWGLRQRVFPWLLRRRWAQNVLLWCFQTSGFQAHFARKHFLGPVDPAWRKRFFEGYAQCAAFGDFFRWFTPEWLGVLERQFAAHPERLAAITVWLGGRDQVVDRREVDATRRTLGIEPQVITFPHWGHYPMIDVPEEWADALCHGLETPERVP